MKSLEMKFPCCDAFEIAYGHDMVYMDDDGFWRAGPDFLDCCPWCTEEISGMEDLEEPAK